MPDSALWYERPAREWTQALPLGNGRLGAMLHGRVGEETVSINDATAWSGSPASEWADGGLDSTVAANALQASRDALAGRDFASAESALHALQHRYSQAYLPFADLLLSCHRDGVVSDYRRVLDLETATHHQSYRIDGFLVAIDSYVSHPDGVLVIDVRTEHPEGVDLGLRFVTQLVALEQATAGLESWMTLKLPVDVAPPHHDVTDAEVYADDGGADDSRSVQGVIVARWSHDGVAQPGAELAARGVRAAQILVTTNTTFVGMAVVPLGTAQECLRRARQVIGAAEAKGAVDLRESHLADYQRLWSRSSLTTGPSSDAARHLPTDQRLSAINASGSSLATDPGLIGLLYNYGRYLLISCSRPGGLPANLQGIWNESLRPPWSSNFTTNINVQMNYWGAEVAGLAETADPYFDLVDALADNGRRVARDLYGLPGWVAHHNTDAWAYAHPVGLGISDPKWAFWPLAPAWLVRQLWERMRHGGGDDFARERAWSIIRSAAEFCLGWLRSEADGTLGTAPSTSPENRFEIDGDVHSVGASSTLDLVLIGDLFDMVATLADRLGLADDAVVVAAREARPRIPGPHIGPDGLIAEWLHDYRQHDPTHRHLSHLYFLYPGDREVGPELARAASLSLDARRDDSTGWSLIWKIAARARLGQARKVSDLLALLFRDMATDRGEWSGGLYPNMFAAHPPFQIDANLGFVGAIAETIVQSHRDRIDLLPAIAPEFATGSATGLIARPGIRVDVRWDTASGEPARLVSAALTAITADAVGPRTVRYGDTETIIHLERDVPAMLP